AISNRMAQRRARFRRHRIPMASRHVAMASRSEARPSPSMKGSPAMANGNAEMPATVHSSACMRSSTNAASGRLDVTEYALGAINSLHHLRIDVHRERSALGVVDDPHVEHRRGADVDRTEGARRERGHEAELEAD